MIVRHLDVSPRPIAEAVADLPHERGIYAWWAPPTVLPDLPGRPNSGDPSVRLLYVGIAGACSRGGRSTTSTLHSRISKYHLRRTASSTLRRSLAGLLLDSEGYCTRGAGRSALIREDEARLTAWMRTHLLISWVQCPFPGDVEDAVIGQMHPPLNITHAQPGPVRDRVMAARKRLRRQ